MQINQQYQQQNQSRSNAEAIKCEEKSEAIKRELGDLRALEKGTAMVQVPNVSESYLEEDRQERREEELRVHCCEFCPLVTLVEQNLRDHVRDKHPSRERDITDFLNCPACENKFRKSNSLKVHLEVDHMMDETEVNTLIDGRFLRVPESTNGESSIRGGDEVSVVEPVQEVCN